MQFIAPSSQRQRAFVTLATASLCLLLLTGGALLARSGHRAAPPAFTAADYQNFAASIRSGNGHKVVYWFAKGMPPTARIDGYSALTLAAASRQYRLFPILVSHGANVNAQDAYGTTALTRLCQERCAAGDACTYRRLTSASWLLRHGASANAAPTSPVAPLALATLQGDITLIKLLRAHGAIDLSTKRNRSALVASAP